MQEAAKKTTIKASEYMIARWYRSIHKLKVFIKSFLKIVVQPPGPFGCSYARSPLVIYWVVVECMLSINAVSGHKSFNVI